MKKICQVLIMLFLNMHILYADGGTSQVYLISMEPSANANDVLPTVTPIFTFDKAIIEKSVNKQSIQLKQITPESNTIKGNVTVLSGKSLVFMPSKPLRKGTYRIQVNPIKLQKEDVVEVKPQTSWEKFIAWLCRIFYDDITECPLCKYFCDVDNYIKTQPIVYTFGVKDNAPTVTALDVNVTVIELSEHNSTHIRIIATYEDNTTEDVTQKATYTSNDSSVDVNKGIVTSNAEGSATVTAEYASKTINFKVEVYESIGGHLLPHEPDNPDDTLLGVDANDNGVRDEVERWIYKTEYNTHPEINRVIAMQVARFYQMALVDPTNKDDKVDKSLIKSLDCHEYYTDSRGIALGKGGKPLSFDLIFKDKYFNTRERLKTYMDYNYGTGEIKVYTSTPTRLLNASYCDENIDLLP